MQTPAHGEKQLQVPGHPAGKQLCRKGPGGPVSQQCALTAKKANVILGFIRLRFWTVPEQQFLSFCQLTGCCGLS